MDHECQQPAGSVLIGFLRKALVQVVELRVAIHPSSPPSRRPRLSHNRLWFLSAALAAATIVAMVAIIHDTSRQRAVARSLARSVGEQVAALAAGRLEVVALQTFAPVMPWASHDPVAASSALNALVRAQAHASRCRCRDTLPATEFFRYDVSEGSLSRVSLQPSPLSSDTLASKVLEQVALADAERARDHPESEIHLTIGPELGDKAAVTAMQYDSAGAPSFVYGAVMRARDVTPALFRYAAIHASLIDSTDRATSQRGVVFGVARLGSPPIIEGLDASHRYRTTIRSGGAFEGLAVTVGLTADQLPMRVGVATQQVWHLGMLIVATILVSAFAIGSSRRQLLLARARSDFIAGVSHDLRMPLAQILIAGETIALERERNAGDRRELSQTIVREARRLVSIVDNVLLFSRSGSARPRPVLHSVSIDEVLDDVVEAVRLAVEDAGQTITVKATPSLAALGDRQLLRQALVNLVDNALKYGPQGQEIVIGAEQSSAESVHLYVDDKGPGVPAAERARLFEPYERLFRDQTSERTGSGLGLAVVREIAQVCGGRAWLDDAPGGGTRAIVSLVTAEREATAPVGA
jgi:signal transduction histidine kinase